MFKYNIIEKPSFSINKKVLDIIFKSIGNIVEKNQKGTLNIVFLDDDSIKILNKNYRNIDKTTDVLSFHYFENFDKLKNDDIAGEMVFNENKIISQGIDYGLGSEREFYKLVIHSVLHIIGYDHELDNEYLIMQGLEDKIWSEVFEK